jgi:hypothetical protein
VLQQPVQGDVATRLARHDLQDRRRLLTHVRQFMMIAGMLKFSTLLVGQRHS